MKLNLTKELAALKGMTVGELHERYAEVFEETTRSRHRRYRNRHGALLRGLLYCRACDRVMTHTFTTRGNRRYRYYTCTNAVKRGRKACPSGSLPAVEFENAIVDQIRCIGQDAELVAETLEASRRQAEAAIERLTGERLLLERGLTRLHTDIRRTATAEPATAATTAKIADLNDEVRQAENRLAEIDRALTDLQADLLTDTDVTAAFADFDNVWTALSPREQVRILQLLISRVEFDVADSTIEVSFFPAGIKTLAQNAGQTLGHVEDAA